MTQAVQTDRSPLGSQSCKTSQDATPWAQMDTGQEGRPGKHAERIREAQQGDAAAAGEQHGARSCGDGREWPLHCTSTEQRCTGAGEGADRATPGFAVGDGLAVSPKMRHGVTAGPRRRAPSCASLGAEPAGAHKPARGGYSSSTRRPRPGSSREALEEGGGQADGLTGT